MSLKPGRLLAVGLLAGREILPCRTESSPIAVCHCGLIASLCTGANFPPRPTPMLKYRPQKADFQPRKWNARLEIRPSASEKLDSGRRLDIGWLAGSSCP